MQSRNKKSQTAAERAHAARLSAMQCSVCDAPPPSEVHEQRQGQWWTSIPLCESCHRGPVMGWHGQKRAWAVRKLDELDALARVVERLMT